MSQLPPQGTLPPHAPQPLMGTRPVPQYPPARRTSVWRTLLTVFLSLLLVGSIALNLILLVAVGAVSTQVRGAGGLGVQEVVIQKGSLLPGSRVAVVPLEGIVDDRMAEFALDAFDHLQHNLPGAVVVRVNSPGGSPTASDQIWRRIERFQDLNPGVPVVASFGAIAASGGYYLATGCDQILAEPLTITGSIGVITQAFTFEGTLDKLGMTPEVMVADGSPNKDVANTMMRSWGEEDRTKVRMLLNHYYDAFVDRVATGRGHVIPSDQLPEVCNGDIFTAAQAQSAGLIDQQGYQEDAVALARSRAGIPSDGRVVEVVRPKTFWEQMTASSSFNAALSSGLVSERGGIDAAALRKALHTLSRPQVLYLCPLGVQ